MRIIWRFLGQQPYLSDVEHLSVSAGVECGPRPRDRRDHYERVVAREAPGEPQAEGPYERLAQAIFRYEIFPKWLVEGVIRRGPVQVGDTVGIVYHFLPGIDLFFSARVIACFDKREPTVWRTGFTYQTMMGHPELGEETFQVEKDLTSGIVKVSMRSWSRFGTWLTRLAYPYARWVQVRAGHAALDHFMAVAECAQIRLAETLD
ncbi:MAG: DUF1990 family protein [Gemmataceae bacterium]